MHMSARERRLLARVAFLLPMVDASLRVAGFQRTYAWLDRLSPLEATGSVHSVEHVAKSEQTISLAGTGFPLYRPTCLPQSLVLWHLLRSGGAPATLNIGVRRTGHEFTAHAWIEVDGQVINDSPDVGERYTRIDLSKALIIDNK